MKEKVLQKLAGAPRGMRLRYVMDGVGSRLEVLTVLIALESEGKVTRTNVSDPANMEYYYLWHIA